jgi:hypothetical protein
MVKVKNLSKLEKGSLGLSLIGFGDGIYFAINGFCMDIPKSYSDAQPIGMKINYLELTKKEIKRVTDYSFSSEEFNKILNELNLKRETLENTFEYKTYDKQNRINNNYFVLGLMGFVTGLAGFMYSYSERRLKEDKK